MLFSNKQINLILFIALIILAVACVYLGYTSVNEGFDTSTAPNITVPTTTPMNTNMVGGDGSDSGSNTIISDIPTTTPKIGRAHV